MDTGPGRGRTPEPRVSVVIPAYNSGPFVQRTIESVLNQTFEDLEVLVVDDGSTDDTATIVGAFGDRVRLIQQRNSGVAAARNRGVAEARGDLIAFLDHDDVWYPDKLHRQVALLDANPAIGLVYGNAEFIDLADRRMWTYLTVQRLHRGKILVPLFLDCFIPLLTVVVRSGLLREVGGFETRWYIAEDYDVFLRAAERTEVDYVDGIVAGYRIHPGNLSKDFSRRLLEEQEVLSSCLVRNPDLRHKLGDGAVRLRMAGMRCEPGHALLFQGRFAEAGRYFGGRLPGQAVAALPLWAAGRLGPRFVMAARRAYRWVREGLSGVFSRRQVQQPAA